MKKTGALMWVLIGLAAVIAIFVYLGSRPPEPGKYDDFAKCIAQSSTTYYGAWWCPHCQNQGRMFGTSKEYLPYVECSPNGAQGSPQGKACVDAKIESYPTWEFKDGSRLTGEVSLKTLAEKTGCTLPADQ